MIDLDWDSPLPGGHELGAYEARLQNDPYWQKVRKIVIERDCCCQMCFSKTNLRVHHLSYDDFYNPATLITLCEKCHSQVHAYTKAFRENMGEILQACQLVNEAISKIIDPFVFERCSELSPDGDLKFFTGPLSSRIRLNDFIEKLITFDPYANNYQITGDFSNYLYPFGRSNFTRYNKIRLDRKRGGT